MQEEIQGTAVVEVVHSPPHGSGHGESGGVMDVAPTMVAMTWVIFFITLFILYRVAWKPILRALEIREQKIRKSLDDAEAARKAAAEAEERCRAIVADAGRQARSIMEEGRATASQLADAIESKARAEADRAVQDAKREIEAATAAARAVLRRDTAELAVSIAGRLVRENMDTAKNQALASDLAEKL